MMNSNQQGNTQAAAIQPWYRQFWPWFIIALPATAVIASFVTLWLALTHPDHLVIDEEEYRNLNSELKAAAPRQNNKENATDKSVPRSN
jgi:hypothetical protein